ncbi:MAG: phosphatidate cytidylyltransferase [Deltaproteobacteria bacterium]|nr:phosphatidate cytidylyltransferase [Deltaproteobacteria bacterium]
MLRARVLTAAIAIPILIWLIFWASPVWYNAVVLFFTFVSLREMAAMQHVTFAGSTLLTAGGGMVIAVSMLLDPSGAAVSAGLVIALIMTLLGTLVTARDMEQSVIGAGQVLFAAVYGGLLLPHLIWLRALSGGAALVFFLFACVMASDAGGYFGGRAFGKTKLWPVVSPNKTVEGAVSSVFGAMLAGVLFNAVLVHRFGLLEVVLLTVVISVLAQTGDLAESMIKRAYHAKDSGWILPGHGGVLDRTDSMVLPIVFIYYYAG